MSNSVLNQKIAYLQHPFKRSMKFYFQLHNFLKILISLMHTWDVLNQSIPVHEGRSKKWQLVIIKFTKLINYLITMAETKKIQATRAHTKAKGSYEEILESENAVIINASNVL